MKFDFLVMAGILSFVASIAHIAIVIGGPAWYRFFGAGEGMALMAEQGMIKPIVITLLISIVLAVWGAYAWSAAGLLPTLPMLKLVLILISVIYLLRGVMGLIALFVDHPLVSQNSAGFWVWSSLICLCFAAVHIKGVFDKWAT